MSKIFKISLKAARVNAGLTVTQAAKLIGISPTTLIKWEKDSGIVTPNKQLVIQEVYKFPIDYIFFGNELELKSS
ncbi:helix-turn-helix transcriptional regulator [Lysinibacillus xylanilyticus]|uniref:helix-turn-helix transcriptional regulator n=1 Tax=Lysinibacillus xylanilyticus TaxID=582475 RepID=UPI0036DF89C1